MRKITSENITELKDKQERYESILKDMQPTVKKVEEQIKIVEEENKIKNFLNFKTIKQDSTNMAQMIVDNIVDTIVVANLDYNFSEEDAQERLGSKDLRIRKLSDVHLFSKVLYQVEINDYAVTKLTQLIDEGNVAPRNFEVLSDLLKTSIELEKFAIQFQNILEVTYRNLQEAYILQRNLNNQLAGKNKEVKALIENTEEPEIVRIKSANICDYLDEVDESSEKQ
ncbi:MAG: hypothetical protein PHV15_05550 [Thomasclavelia ramosa]|nr:hypothetical protein [Thomasclavelia ramosa]